MKSCCLTIMFVRLLTWGFMPLTGMWITLPIFAKTPGEPPLPTLERETQPVNRATAYYHFSLGRLMEESGNFLKAEAEYRKALEHDSRSSYLRTELANAYLRYNRVTEAIQEFKKAIQFDSNNLRAHKLLGAIYLSILEREQSGHKIPSEDTLAKAIREYKSIGRLDPKDSNSLLVLARLYRYAGKPDHAIETLKRSMEVTASSEETMSMLGQLYRDQNQMQEAIDLFQRALQLNPSSPVLLLQMGLAYEQVSNFKKAVETYRKGMDSDSSNAEFLRKNLAHALMYEGQIDLAEEEYLKILEADPNDGEAHLGLGKICLKRQWYDKALEHLSKGDASIDNNLEVAYELAKLYQDLGQFEEAEQRFVRLLKLFEKPNDSYSASGLKNRSIFLTHLGLISQQLANYEKAATYFQELQRLGKKYRSHVDKKLQKLGKENQDRARVFMITLYRGSNRIPQALSACKAAKQSNPSLIVRALCADVVAEIGDPEQGLQELQTLLQGSKKDIEVYHYILQIYQREKRYKAAETKLYEAEEYFDNEESFYFMLGALQERQKEFGKAAATFRKVIDLDPKHASALNYLGYMWTEQGVRLSEALDLIKKAVALEPNNGAYLDSLGWIYFKLDRIEEAELYLVRALDRVRRDPTIHEHLGDLYYKKGDYQEARLAWQRSISCGQDEEETLKVKKKVTDLETKLALSSKEK